jgi:hypothetical protein
VKTNLTTRDVALLLNRPEWFIRRIVDSLSPPVERFGNKRVVPLARMSEIREAIGRHQARLAEREATRV